jgi:thioredoxin reductase (NADPH)
MNQVTIIGSGPAGLTAAIYAARAGLEPVLYSGLQPGGQLTTTTEIENFPGFEHGIMGPQLMQNMQAQAERFGAKIVADVVTKVDFSGATHKMWVDDKLVESRAVIICTGATAKTLGLPEEARLMGRGISTCATCDGFFYRNKRVIIAGGGDSAMEEASYLSKLASEVYLIHRRDEFRASPIMARRVRENPKIKIITPAQILGALESMKGLTGIKYKNLKSGETHELAADGLFMAIGHKPNSEMFLPWVDLDEHGYIKTSDGGKTKTRGVYAAGDVADPRWKQAITAAGMGCQAALSVQHYLES